MTGVEHSNRKRHFYPYTIAWFIFYILCLGLSQVRSFPTETGYFFAFIAIGVILTVLACLEWSVHILSRRLALFFITASLAWWTATMMLARSDYDFRWFQALNSIILLVGTFAIGFWLAGELEKSGHLLPVAILGALVDIWSVFMGPSKMVGQKVVEHYDKIPGVISPETWVQPPIVNFLLVNFPQPGTNYSTPTFGFGDWVFVGIFLAGCRKFGIPVYKTVGLVLLGMGLSIAVSLRFNMPVPALPFICGAFIAGNYDKLELTQKEWKLTWTIVAAIFTLGIISLLKTLFL